jgi:hypothetical protein
MTRHPRADLRTPAGSSAGVALAPVRDMFAALVADQLDVYLRSHPRDSRLG